MHKLAYNTHLINQVPKHIKKDVFRKPRAVCFILSVELLTCPLPVALCVNLDLTKIILPVAYGKKT